MLLSKNSKHLSVWLSNCKKTKHQSVMYVLFSMLLLISSHLLRIVWVQMRQLHTVGTLKVVWWSCKGQCNYSISRRKARCCTVTVRFSWKGVWRFGWIDVCGEGIETPENLTSWRVKSIRWYTVFTGYVECVWASFLYCRSCFERQKIWLHSCKFMVSDFRKVASRFAGNWWSQKTLHRANVKIMWGLSTVVRKIFSIICFLNSYKKINRSTFFVVISGYALDLHNL